MEVIAALLKRYDWSIEYKMYLNLGICKFPEMKSFWFS